MAAKARKSSTKSVSKAGVSRAKSANDMKSVSKAGVGNAGKKDSVSLEIKGVVIIAVSIFLILGIYTEDKAGKIGVILKAGFVGLFGFGAYIFPLIVIGVCLYVLFSRSKSVQPKRFIAAGILFITAVVAAHVFSMEDDLTFESVSDYIVYYFVNGGSKNGGLLGAVLGNLLVGIFSHIGTYILIFSSTLVCFIALTGKSFFKGVARLGSLIRDFFTFGEFEDEDEYEYEDEPVNIKPTKKPEKKESLSKNETVSATKRSAIPAIAPDKDPSSYTFEITSAAPADRRIKLISEELSRGRRDRGLIINSEKMNREDLSYRSYEEKRIFEEQNKPSVKLDMNERKPYSESETHVEEKEQTTEFAISDVPDTISSEDIDIILDDSPDTVEEDGDDYGGDILFNSSPAYEDVPEEDDAEIPEKYAEEAPKEKERKPEVFRENRIVEYVYPPIDLLNVNPNDASMASKAMILENSKKLEDALRSFKVEAKVMEVNVGPTVTRYELSPGVGVKVSSISNLSDDLALNLAASGIRIEAPIPGKAAVGIEVPNKEAQPVYLREVISDNKFKTFPSKLAFALGKDIAGNVVIADIAKMPHMLIAGSTGSGKSVCINTLVSSIIYKSRPEDVKLLMVDPKVVELKVYNGIPHLLIPVVTDPKKAAGALNWAVREMTTRYGLFAETSVRDLKGYNQLCVENGEETIPQIVIIIDELADLMMTAGKEVEEYICRLAQMARAAGIHLIIATQRPSVDVITGLIKANIPSKIAFAVSSAIDSRTILGEGGAEKLLGRGDMLFYPTGMSKPLRVQGSFISDKEVEAVVSFVKQGASVEYDEKVIENITSAAGKAGGEATDDDEDEFMDPAIEFIVKKEKASASLLQRQFRIGYNRASRLIEILEERGIVGPEDGSKPRKVLMSKYEWEDYQNRRHDL